MKVNQVNEGDLGGNGRSVCVLKFGSSVLGAEEDFEEAVHEIYRYVRRGDLVVAVVSAMGNTTNTLVEQGTRFGGGAGGGQRGTAYALLLAGGEMTSVALLTLALERVGVSAAPLNINQLGLKTNGDPLDAIPLGVNQEFVASCFAEHSVIVVPGFLGVGAAGEVTLLGRGGSDLSALFLADKLHARECVLLKDQLGVFDKDPARNRDARLYETLSYGDARSLEQVVAPRALAFAAARELSFVVRRCGEEEGTRVGLGPSRFVSEKNSGRRLKVALLGRGTVGEGVHRALGRHGEHFEVVGIGVRNKERHLADGVPKDLLWTDLQALLNRDIDVVVEMLGGVEPCLGIIRDSLSRGRHVVSANKAVLAAHGQELQALAATSGSTLSYSASVGGGAPILEMFQRVDWDSVVGVEGVLNGTTNYILEKLGAGASWSTAVEEAKAHGFAESDPTYDLDGTDAAQKLAIVLGQGVGRPIELESLCWEGITELSTEAVLDAKANGERIRLVASYSPGGKGTVAPRSVPMDSLLGMVNDEWNRVIVYFEGGESVTVDGKGAGRWPTAESVFADLMDICRDGGAVRPENHN